MGVCLRRALPGSFELCSAMSVSESEVAKHASDSDCWVIVGDDVYDVTKFLPDHPGRKKAIMLFAGKDATEEFDMLHDRKVIKKYGIDQGTVFNKGKLAKRARMFVHKCVSQHSLESGCSLKARQWAA